MGNITDMTAAPRTITDDGGDKTFVTEALLEAQAELQTGLGILSMEARLARGIAAVNLPTAEARIRTGLHQVQRVMELLGRQEASSLDRRA